MLQDVLEALAEEEDGDTYDDEDDDEVEEPREIGLDEDAEEEEDCFEDSCSEEPYAGVRNVGFLGKLARTLAYFTPGKN